jgi:hypothetical protein
VKNSSDSMPLMRPIGRSELRATRSSAKRFKEVARLLKFILNSSVVVKLVVILGVSKRIEALCAARKANLPQGWGAKLESSRRCSVEKLRDAQIVTQHERASQLREIIRVRLKLRRGIYSEEKT